jgi:copper chaperone CopZ
METLTLILPAMFGDHHVIEVRRVLLELPGITEVYASSYAQTVDLTYNPAEIDPDVIRGRLAEAGYDEDWAMPVETGTAAYAQNNQPVFFRHTASYEHVGRTVSFAQKVSYSGRALWPCPGIGPVHNIPEGE